MKTFLTAFGGAIVGTVLGAILLFLIASAVIGGFVNSKLSAFQDQGKASGNVVLSLDLRQEISDQPATTGLPAIFGQKGFVNVLTRLDAARTDDDIKGVLIADAGRWNVLRLRVGGFFPLP